MQEGHGEIRADPWAFGIEIESFLILRQGFVGSAQRVQTVAEFVEAGCEFDIIPNIPGQRHGSLRVSQRLIVSSKLAVNLRQGSPHG